MPIDYDALIKKEQQKLNAAKARLAEIASKKRTADRAARTRDLIQLGGLVAIAKERHPKIDSAELILGVLDWAGESADRPDKVDMVASFADRGRKILAERSQKK